MAQPSTLPPLVRGEPIPMTWEEFIAWDVEGKTEWVDGEGIAYVSNSARHVRLVVFLAGLLGRYVRAFDLGEVFIENLIVRLPTRPSGRAPDVFIVGRSDAGRVLPRWVEGPVPFAVEIVSEDSVERDTVEKRSEYEQAGVTEYLIVEAGPNRRGVTFLRLDDDGRYRPVEPDEDGRYHSAVLTGFWFHPEWFGQDPLPEVDDLLLEIAPDAYEAWLLARIRARRGEST
jgi:Uma2 family endonuclease